MLNINSERYYANGDVYIGKTNGQKRHGFGKMVYKAEPGDEFVRYYEGEWRDDLKDGQGKQQYADGTVHEGYYKEDKRHGRGRIVYLAGPGDLCEECYEGQFANDLFVSWETAVLLR